MQHIWIGFKARQKFAQAMEPHARMHRHTAKGDLFMALFSIPRDDAKYGVTPVENLFIQEYMLIAPGDYVKVYLYALLQATHPAASETSMEKVAASLSLEPQRMQDALRYWQRHGLMRLSEIGCELLDVRNAMCDGKALHERTMYQYASLNHELDRITGGRAFSNNDYNMIYDWIEVFGLSEETVLALVLYCVENKGKKFRMNYAMTIARDWEKSGIKTPDSAADYIDQYLLSTSPANKIVADFGYKRRATIDEHHLYQKWAKEWAFSPDAISAARETATGMGNPNFKYLDRVIESMYKRGQTTAHKIRKDTTETNELKKIVQECAKQLGVNVVTEEHISYYKKWTEDYGLSHDALVFACRKASARNARSFKDADASINSYVLRNIKTVEAMEQDIRLEADLARVYECAGVKSGVNERDKGLLNSFLSEGTALELILQAAEYSVGSERPLAFISKVLKNWKEQGITTVAAARKAHEARKNAFKDDKKSNGKFDYEQRDYDKSELEALFENFGEEGS